MAQRRASPADALVQSSSLWTAPVGYSSLSSLTKGGNNTAVGEYAMNGAVTGSNNTAISVAALYNNDYNNCTGLGSAAGVSGDNQVQLGNSSTTAYAFGAVQNRSDERDKADIRDTVLGLDFVLALRPLIKAVRQLAALVAELEARS